MAVFTIIPQEALVTHLQQFDIGSLLSYDGISEGVENTNYVVRTTAGKFILTLFEGRVSLDDLPYYIGFMEYLSQRGIPAPSVITSKHGQKITPLLGKPSAITTFLEGAWPRVITAAHTDAIGAQLAEMHRQSVGFQTVRKNTLWLNEWQRLIDACGAKANTIESGLADFLEQELHYLEKNIPVPGTLPTGAVHADLFPDNVFFNEGKLSGVIDFYFSCQESFIYDLMIVLNAWCFDGKGMLDKEKSSALLRAYQSVRTLTEKEVQALPLFGRAAAIRIIATRLYDLLYPKPGGAVVAKNPLEHVYILRFHQRISSVKEYGLIDP